MTDKTPAPYVDLPVPGAGYMIRVPRPIPDDHPFFSATYDDDTKVLTVEATNPSWDTKSITLAVSREVALDYGLIEPTPEEKVRRDAEMAAFQHARAAARAKPGPELTIQSVLLRLEWSPAYAEHWLHPECWCDPFSDDPYLCDWGRDLGFTAIGGHRE